MSETKHSEGPWTVGQFGMLRDGKGEQVLEYGSGIASAGMPTDEYRANAKLRNAAPELLEALKDYVAALPQFWASDTHCTEMKPDEADYPDGEWLDIAAKAKAAIAKAEGRDTPNEFGSITSESFK